MARRTRTVLLATMLLASISAIAPPLPNLRIDPAAVSVSGVSSGADMAVQLLVAFSETFSGAGIFAGQAGGCAVTRFPDDPLLPRTTRAQESVPVCEGCPPNETLTYDHCKVQQAAHASDESCRPSHPRS